jgi:1,4-dihydroxy-2-naphthoyl-CoA hydrolase
VNDAAGITYDNTILESLGIRVLEMTADRVTMELDIGPQVHQPMGILHGGASAVLAESAASMGTFMNCDPEKEYAVGIELSVSHLKSKTAGLLKATATPIRKGRSVHVWNIDLTDENEDKVAVSRCTVLIRSWNSDSEPKGA